MVSSALENERQNNGNATGPTSSEQGYAADVDGDAVVSQRPDTPHPDRGIVQSEELVQRVARWVNDGVDGNWELIRFSLGSQETSTGRSREVVHDGANSTVGMDTAATNPDYESETPVEMLFSGEDSIVLCQRPERCDASGAASVGRGAIAETELVGEEVENGCKDGNVIRRQSSCPDFSGEHGVQGTQETSVAGD